MSGLIGEVAGRRVTVSVRRSPLARAVSLRVDPVRGVVLVLPPRARLGDAQGFLAAHQGWLARRLERLPTPLPLIAGASVPIGGRDLPIRHCPEARRGAWIEGDCLCVSGDADHLPRRVGDFLKAEARRRLVTRTHQLAARVERKPGRITLKDTVSRWGSCSSQGHIALSWRLVMAPDWVADYVVGHEVAHLVEMNHSSAFWAVVRSLGLDERAARAWLKSNGAQLHRYRVEGEGFPYQE